QRVYEVQDYMTVMDFADTLNVLALSDNVWQQLSDEQQSALNEDALETAEQWSEEADEENEEILKELEDKMDIVTRENIDIDDIKQIIVEQAHPKYEKDYGSEFVEFLEKVQSAAE